MTSEHQSRQRRRLTATVTDLEVVRQRAFLISVRLGNDSPLQLERSVQELELLTDTAGSDPVASVIVSRARPDPATFIGPGQARELAIESMSLDTDVVVFDNDLTPAQQRNLQAIFQTDVVDRVAVILDIFAQHATSREGMMQVELALLRYHLPRLRGQGTKLSRQAGGIGTRGPGETKLETDRRRITQRMAKLVRDLDDLRGVRDTQRKARRRKQIPTAALVGYTNAGKSTLLNALTDAGVLTEDQLFSTLDSTTRRWQLPGGQTVLLSDTVGFVQRLPHQLVEAFRSTLQEVSDADLLLHVVDASDPGATDQIAAVREVLESIDAGSIPELLILNKLDVAEQIAVDRLQQLYPGAVAASALIGDGLPNLGEAIGTALTKQFEELSLVIPYERGDLLASLHRDAEILEEVHGDSATRLTVRVPPDVAARLAPFASE